MMGSEAALGRQNESPTGKLPPGSPRAVFCVPSYNRRPTRLAQLLPDKHGRIANRGKVEVGNQTGLHGLHGVRAETEDDRDGRGCSRRCEDRHHTA
jgi:hypothetical protein